MPEMSEENYSAILSAIDELRAKNVELEKRLTDMTTMNKALLSSRGGQQDNKVDPQVRRKELEEKLKGSIR